MVAAYGDIVVRNQASTIQYLHYLLTIGLVVWATSQFASYAVFGHHRPLSAVTVVGLLLVGNMAITINDQLLYLVLYSLGGAVPADPLARPRGAVRVGASADRRSVVDLVGLPARRNGVHRRGRGGGAAS